MAHLNDIRDSALNERAEGLSICGGCGAVLPPNARFCDKCGRPVSSEPYPDTDDGGRRGFWASDLQHCAKCGGGFLDKDDLFCRSCGAYRSGDPGRFFVPDPQYLDEGQSRGAGRRLFYRCAACGHKWEGPETERDRFCPKCGAGVTGSESGFVLRTKDGREIEIPERGCVVGRQGVGKDILADPSVSRLHARLEPQGASALLITDISRNGTFVNGERLTKELPTAVSAGSVIRFGEVIVTLGKEESGSAR